MAVRFARAHRLFCLFRTVLLFAAIFSAMSFVGSRAMAWGLMKEMDGSFKYAHLVFPVYKNHQINYCITLSESDLSPRAGFTYKTINTEARIALREWLSAVSDLTGPVKLKRVHCQSPTVNLIIYLGAPQMGSMSTPSFSQADPYMRSHNYEYVSINTVGRYPLDDVSMPVIDFSKLIPSQMGLASALKFLINQKMSNKQIVKWAGLPSEDITEVYNNSFTFMLHEFGHAFGLCDTYKSSTNCDPNYSSTAHLSEQPPSVMQWDRPVYLYPDDIEGIRQLFKRFAPAN